MLYLDLETYSECNLKQAGAARYAEDQTTEILLVAYAFDEDEVEVWDATRSSEMPAALHTYLAGQKPVAIHNSYFDRSVLQEVLGIHIKPERIVDTMVQALSHGMPGELDLLGQIFSLDSDKAKMKEGRQLVLQFCKPLRGARSTRLSHPTRWELFKEYAKQDVVAMRELHRLLPKWNYPGLRFEDGEPSEWHRLWVLDQQINDRGFLCDIDLAEKAVKAAAAERDYLNASTQAVTAGAVEAATQRDALIVFLEEEYGVAFPDMRQDTLQRRVDDESLPLEVRELLALRIQSSRNSAAKYTAVMRAVCADNRLRGGLQHRGAPTTGRWCLAEGTLVLTRRNGEVCERQIEDVTLADEVWDGDEWVSHEGVVFSGDKPVIEHDGVIATAEHIVYLSTSESLTLGEAKAKGAKLWKGSFTPTS